MLKKDVKIGATYIVLVSGKLTQVRLQQESVYGGGWVGVNVATGRQVRVRSAQRLRSEVE